MMLVVNIVFLTNTKNRQCTGKYRVPHKNYFLSGVNQNTKVPTFMPNDELRDEMK